MVCLFFSQGKRAAETLCFDYARKHNVTVRVARIFNTYGPRMAIDDGRVVSNFIVQALRGEPLTIYGEGQQTRSFCYVDDLVRGLMCLMEDSSEAGPFNFGNPGEYTIRELAEIIRRLTSSSSSLVKRPLPADDPRQRQPDISRARRALGFSPTVDLHEGLKRTVTYFVSRTDLL